MATAVADDLPHVSVVGVSQVAERRRLDGEDFPRRLAADGFRLAPAGHADLAAFRSLEPGRELGWRQVHDSVEGAADFVLVVEAQMHGDSFERDSMKLS